MAKKLISVDNLNVIKDYILSKVMSESDDIKRVLTEENEIYLQQKLLEASESLKSDYESKYDSLTDELERLKADGADKDAISELELRIDALNNNYVDQQNSLSLIENSITDIENSVMSPGQLNELIETAFIDGTYIQDDSVSSPNMFTQNLVALIAKFGTVRALNIIGDEIEGKTISSVDGNWHIGKDGDGSLAGGNISWDENGNVTFGEDVKIGWGNVDGTDLGMESFLATKSYATQKYVNDQIVSAGGMTEEDVNTKVAAALESIRGTYATIGDLESTTNEKVSALNNTLSLSIDAIDTKYQLESTALTNALNQAKTDLQTAITNGDTAAKEELEGKIRELNNLITAVDGKYVDVSGGLSALQTSVGNIESQIGSVMTEDAVNDLISTAFIDGTYLTSDAVVSPNVFTTKLCALVAKFGTIQASQIQGDTIEGKSIRSTDKISGTNTPTWEINNTGGGHLANGNISWDSNGAVTFGDDVNLSWASVNGSYQLISKIPYLRRRDSKVDSANNSQNTHDGYTGYKLDYDNKKGDTNLAWLSEDANNMIKVTIKKYNPITKSYDITDGVNVDICMKISYLDGYGDTSWSDIQKPSENGIITIAEAQTYRYLSVTNFRFYIKSDSKCYVDIPVIGFDEEWIGESGLTKGDVSNLISTQLSQYEIKSEQLTGKTITGATIQSSNGSWKIGENGDGWLANKNISWDSNGTLTIGNLGSLNSSGDCVLNKSKLDDTEVVTMTWSGNDTMSFDNLCSKSISFGTNSKYYTNYLGGMSVWDNLSTPSNTITDKTDSEPGTGSVTSVVYIKNTKASGEQENKNGFLGEFYIENDGCAPIWIRNHVDSAYPMFLDDPNGIVVKTLTASVTTENVSKLAILIPAKTVFKFILHSISNKYYRIVPVSNLKTYRWGGGRYYGDNQTTLKPYVVSDCDDRYYPVGSGFSIVGSELGTTSWLNQTTYGYVKLSIPISRPKSCSHKGCSVFINTFPNIFSATGLELGQTYSVSSTMRNVYGNARTYGFQFCVSPIRDSLEYDYVPVDQNSNGYVEDFLTVTSSVGKKKLNFTAYNSSGVATTVPLQISKIVMSNDAHSGNLTGSTIGGSNGQCWMVNIPEPKTENQEFTQMTLGIKIAESLLYLIYKNGVRMLYLNVGIGNEDGECINEFQIPISIN